MSKKSTLTIGLLLLMLMFLCYPNLCLQAAQDGLLLWFNKVLPSLLPFMILINILVPLDGLQSFITWCTPLSKRIWHLPGESFFAFLIGLIAGYPMGAKVIKSLYTDHKLTKEEAERTLCFCNNCGPLFIIGTIGTAMLSQTNIGYFLFFIHLLSALTMSLLLTHSFPLITSSIPNRSAPNTYPNFFKLLNLGVMNAMDTIVCVGGYIILFSVLLALLTQTPYAEQLCTNLFPMPNASTLIKGILSSILELSNGAYNLSRMPINTYSLALISAAIGFGGLCVYFQALFVLEDTPFDTKPFFISKCLQGLLSFAFTLVLAPIYFNHTQNKVYTSGTISYFSSIYLWIALACFALSILLSRFIFKKTNSCTISKKLPISKSS
ncbi:MAG: hypothetical protein J6F30_12425 [Cellulosilyticum sp.]|nr:hypothetical protein [Cellulosilyticum sp.]